MFRLAVLLFLLFSAVPRAAAEWKRSAPGWEYTFPQDEYSHPDFKTEWWYFTGNLREKSTDRTFGYQLTFFRQGLRPPRDRSPVRSGFVTDHFWFAHFAVSDLTTRRFRATERASRGSFGEAGSQSGDPAERIVWIQDWTVTRPDGEPGRYVLEAAEADGGFSLQLDLRSSKPPVVHGEGGISAKSADPANASHYFSHPRLATSGEVKVGDRSFEVEGSSWFDREWSTSVLGEGMTGWDWFSIQFDGPEARELMLFRLRDPAGEDAFTSGTWIEPDGTAIPLAHGDIRFTPNEPRNGGRYPLSWRIEVPTRGIDLRVAAAMPDQELKLAAVRYWEGAIAVDGTLRGQPASGRGYLEMTGYASDLPGLR